jgi:hypothetical protein
MGMTKREWLLSVVKEVNEESGHHTTRLEEPDENGVEWVWVGHNSTHQFYLGVDSQDRLWRKSGAAELPKGFHQRNWPQPCDGAPEAICQAWWKAYHRLIQEHERWEEHVRMLQPGEPVGYVGHW